MEGLQMAARKPYKYKVEFCQRLIEHMKEGLSYESFASLVSVTDVTLRAWEKFPEWKEAKSLGYVHNLIFWEKIGIAGAMGKIKNFNVVAWIFNMKNRHHWRDRVDIEQRTNVFVQQIDKLKELPPDEISKAYFDLVHKAH